MDFQKILTWIKANLRLFIIIIVILLLLIIWLCMGSDKENAGSNGGGLFGSKISYDNSEELEEMIQLIQSNYSVYIFGSDEDGDNKTDTLNYSVTPTVNFSMSSGSLSEFEVKSVKITNMEATSAPSVGRVIRTFPNHTLPASESCLGLFYDGCDNAMKPSEAKDMGSEKEFIVLESGTEPAFFDETPSWNFLPKFKFTVVDAGSIDQEAIMERDNFFNGGSVLAYSGVSSSSLAGTFVFDVLIDTSHGEYRKGFEIVVSADELVGGGRSNLEIDVEK
jgi:hypothetical protein